MVGKKASAGGPDTLVNAAGWFTIEELDHVDISANIPRIGKIDRKDKDMMASGIRKPASLNAYTEYIYNEGVRSACYARCRGGRVCRCSGGGGNTVPPWPGPSW